ncbi:MAG: ATP-binding cassette domain-containing protein, partial [Desulfatiglandales bacterium]|nr:ATP-binding cassette domain-containing protein [Desulfatiglandales bacterium]
MIKVESLSKTYGERLAVDNISFTIGQGEIVGFLGPNGAGKTTTMRAITGYLMPEEGEVWVADFNMRKNPLEAREKIGYLPETIPLYTDMTTRSYLDFAARLRGLDRKKTQQRIDEVVEVCQLGDYIDVLTGKLSKGFRQRVGIAQAIIHDPEVLILDEPTVGIDPLQVVQTKELIKELGRKRTILLSSHILPEVNLICERVIIINHGKIVAEDNIEKLSNYLNAKHKLRLRIDGPADKVLKSLSKIDELSEVTYQEPYHLLEFEEGK